MLTQYCLFIFTILSSDFAHTQDAPEEPAEDAILADGEKKLSDNILAILDHYRQPDPVGLPGVDIPDPYPVPDTKAPISYATMYLKNTNVYGISKFRVVYVNTEISTMQVEAGLIIDNLQARGNYTTSLLWTTTSGPFTIDVTGLEIKALAGLGVERDGQLRAQDISIDLTIKTVNVNFENLGFIAGVFQGLVNTVGSNFFDYIKPYILKEAHTKARTEINKKLDEVSGDIQFPNSISPLDMVIADLRKKVRDMNLDPYKVQNYNMTVSMFHVKLRETWITGISSFQRFGNISLKIENKTVIADFEIGTQKLEGRTQWEISALNAMMSKHGAASFSVEYISARIILEQPLDVREKPEFRSLNLDIGNIQMRCDGAGTLDYIVESVVNILPNILRYQIMHAMERPLKAKIQKELDEIEVEEMIMQKLEQIDEMQKSSFKLSAVWGTDVKSDVYDEDDFFNF